MSQISRRDLLKLGSTGAVAGVAAVASLGAARSADAAVGSVHLPYPTNGLGSPKDLKEGVPVPFTYPDPASPCALLKLGRAVPGGVGPQGDLVAYSLLCTHRGAPLQYDGSARTFKCPLHYSIFDPEKSGQMVCGQATENLPHIVLEYDFKDDRISAVSVEGLIYGRASNVLSEA
jgi:arsenite oxidase small subunit